MLVQTVQAKICQGPTVGLAVWYTAACKRHDAGSHHTAVEHDVIHHETLTEKGHSQETETCTCMCVCELVSTSPAAGQAQIIGCCGSATTNSSFVACALQTMHMLLSQAQSVLKPTHTHTPPVKACLSSGSANHTCRAFYEQEAPTHAIAPCWCHNGNVPCSKTSTSNTARGAISN